MSASPCILHMLFLFSIASCCIRLARNRLWATPLLRAIAMQILRACGSLALIFMAGDAAMVLKSHCQHHGLGDTITKALECVADPCRQGVAASRRSKDEEEMSFEEPDAGVLPPVRAELGRMAHASSRSMDHHITGRPTLSSRWGPFQPPGRPFDRSGWPAQAP